MQKRPSAAARVRQDDDRARDAFLTKPQIAADLVGTVLLPFLASRRFVADLVLEPAAGAGAFMEAFPQNTPVIGLDISPQSPDILTADFLAWSPDPKFKKILVVGNPPFGKNASLAIKFVNRSAGFAEIVAMILPRTFRKESVKSRLAKGLVAVLDVDVPDGAFLFKGETKSVPCCFMVFITDPTHERPLRKPLSCSDFTFVSKGQGLLSFQRVGVNAGTVRKGFSDRAPASHYFLLPAEGHSADSISDVLAKIDWRDIKDASAGNPSIPKRELIFRYLSAKKTD